MKLKVLSIEDTPKNAPQRVVLSRDSYENREWARETMDNAFWLWSNSQGHHGDMIYDRNTKRSYECDSPFEEIEDEDGYGTGEHRERPGLIVIPVDIYEHSGRAWAIRGEGGVCFSCPWDSTSHRREAPFYLWTDKEKWEAMGGSAKWEFVDGKPSEALMKNALELARAEVKMMNLCEQGDYYGYQLQLRIIEDSDVTTTHFDGEVTHETRYVEDWDDDDSCGGFLTDKPAEEVDFPLGIPVVSDNEYLVGDTFEQECFALSDDATGKFLAAFKGAVPALVDDPVNAFVCGREFLESNRKHYEDEAHKALTVVDVTERIWSRWPECHA